jgi:hypothetical protein
MTIFTRKYILYAVRMTCVYNLKVGCLHPVACTRSGSGFPSNATLFLCVIPGSRLGECGHCYFLRFCIVSFGRLVRPKHVAVTE